MKVIMILWGSAVARWLLMILAAHIVHAGIWTDAEAVKYAEGASIALVSLAWSMVEKYHVRIELKRLNMMLRMMGVSIEGPDDQKTVTTTTTTIIK